jgi:hypothetical protein
MCKIAFVLALGSIALCAPLESLASRVNLAKYQNVTSSSQDNHYVADFAVDGIVSNFHVYRTGDTPGRKWLELDYPRAVTLGSAHLYSGLIKDSITEVFEDFTIQYRDGNGWIDVPGSTTTANSDPEVNVIFSTPVTSDRFRFLSSDLGNRAIRQLAFFPPNPDAEGAEQGFSLGTGVKMNLTYRRPINASSINNDSGGGANYAINAVDGYVDNSSRWWCIGQSPGQTLEIDLLETHAIGSAHFYSGNFGNANNPNPLADFTLEYWSGTEWLAIPGAVISGNTSTAKVISFTSTVVTDKVRLVTNNNSFARVAQLLFFPPRDGGYPLGQDVKIQPPPADTWLRFEDRSWGLRCGGPDSSIDQRLVSRPGSFFMDS